MTQNASAYDFTLGALKGGPLPLAQFSGRPMLIVNTASKCGFTPQYAALQAVSQRYKDRGLVVLGVPSNDFGRQEPGSETEIAEFCQVNYGVDFPMAAKEHVRGRDAHPLFQWLHREGGWLSGPRWNFYKFVVDREGHFRDWFAATTKPDAPRLLRVLDQAVATNT